MQSNYSNFMSFSEIDWSAMRGPLPFRMSNDYLFHAIMQYNNKVLKSLVCSLLHLDSSSVGSVIITNPIELGETIDSKYYILDIRVNLDNRLVINLELQVLNEGDWPERSLCYLCRCFDNLNRGDEYINIRPAIQIGILNFTLFQDIPEFYATYQLLNIKNHKLFSDKLTLSVLELNQIAIATEEDKRYRLDCWAKFFRAVTWEELYMIGKGNDIFEEAVATVYHLSQDERIRQQCEAREDYYRHTQARERLLQEKIQEADRLSAERNQAISENKRLRQLLIESGIDPD